MSTGSYLESHIGISPDPFLELSAEERGRKVRERMGDLHAFLDDGKPLEERDLPELSRRRALELRQAVAQATGTNASSLRALDARFLTDAFVRSEYTKDQNVYLGSFFTRRLTEATPDFVFQPVSAAEVAAAVRWARGSGVPVTLRGAGTTAMGGAVPAAGGAVLDLTRLDGIEIDENEGLALIGAGARFRPVHRTLAEQGLALRVYTSNLGGTFAGWFATGGIGLNAYSGGRARDAVRWAEVVLPTGDLVRLFRGRDLELDVFDSPAGPSRHLEGPEASDWFRSRGLPALALDDLSGTEGQFGVLTRLAIEMQPRPEMSCFLLAFATEAASFECADWVRRWAGSAFPQPANLKWLSASHLEHERKAWADDDVRPWRSRPSALTSIAAMPWKRLAGPRECGLRDSAEDSGEPAAYLYVDFPSIEAGRAFARSLTRAPGDPRALHDESLRFAAERFRPQSVKRLGPGLLAAEILLPAERVPAFLRAAPSVARGAGVDLDSEVYYLADGTALVIAGYLCDHRRGSFFFELLVAPALVDLAMDRFEGRPYVLGRWQSGFFGAGPARERARALRQRKQAADPRWILGRGALFSPGFRGPLGGALRYGFGPGVRIARLFYEIGILRPLVGAARALLRGRPGPLAGRGAPVRESPPTEDGTFLPATAAQRAGTCVNCGECNTVCPVFRDSSVRLPQMLTHLGEAVAAGGEPGRSGSVLLDLCMRCGNCEEVCQAGIPHLSLYEAVGSPGTELEFAL